MNLSNSVFAAMQGVGRVTATVCCVVREFTPPPPLPLLFSVRRMYR